MTLASETTIDTTTLQVLIIVFIATLIRSAFGFGEALIAVPLLAFFIPLEVAAPLVVLVSITIAGAPCGWCSPPFLASRSVLCF
jgi:uncharacterized membrane protein YfcA